MQPNKVKCLKRLMVISVIFVITWYAFWSRTDIKHYQNAYSGGEDHFLSEPDNKCQQTVTVAVGLSNNIVTHVLRNSNLVIAEELPKSHPINRTQFTKSQPINMTELTKSHPRNRTKKHISTNGWRVRPHTCTNCFRHDFVYLIQNEDICSETNKDTVDLIILILTRHISIYNRNVIRSTWASISRNNTGNVRYVFLLGKVPRHELMEKVQLEALHYKDMLMEDFRDTYSNLTYKTIMGLKWASSFCENAKFVLKTDDDMWVNVPQMLRLVNRNRLFLQSGVAGRCKRRISHREKTSKWYITFEEYPLPLFPQYCVGSGYITSMAVTKQVYNISRHVPFLKFEDVYFGMCVKAIGKVDFMSNQAFHYDGDFREKPCILKSKYVLTCHEVPLPMMQEVMEDQCI